MWKKTHMPIKMNDNQRKVKIMIVKIKMKFQNVEIKLF